MRIFYLMHRTDDNTPDSEINTNIPFLTLLTLATNDNGQQHMDVWDITAQSDCNLSSDDNDEEIQQARKFIIEFNEE